MCFHHVANATARDEKQRAALKGKCVSQRQSKWMCALTCATIDTRAFMQMDKQVCLLKIGECMTQPEVGRRAARVPCVRQQR